MNKLEIKNLPKIEIIEIPTEDFKSIFKDSLDTC